MNEMILMLLPLLIQVESGGDPNTIGDNGKAYGVLQVWDITVRDVNRIYGHRYTHEMMLDERHSKNLAIYYLMHWGEHYEKKTGKKATMEVLARIWNGGPNGWKKKATNEYWEKVLDKMKAQTKMYSLFTN
jgi:hypothetical protein